MNQYNYFQKKTTAKIENESAHLNDMLNQKKPNQVTFVANKFSEPKTLKPRIPETGIKPFGK